MSTSGTMKQQYRVCGILSFKIADTLLRLNVYQSKSLMATKDYSDYLFVPFTDKTTGFETYGAGRYIDLKIGDINNNSFILDFNKAYNPYCAYAAGFNCPVPPKENDLNISILVGEKKLFEKTLIVLLSFAKQFINIPLGKINVSFIGSDPDTRTTN